MTVMQLVSELNDFEVLIGESLDICVIEVEGEPYHNVLKLLSYLDFDDVGMLEIQPPMCYIDDYLEQKDLYKSLWDYASDFSSYEVPLRKQDPIRELLMNAVIDIGDKARWETCVLIGEDEIDQLRKLNSGLYLVGFTNGEKVSSSACDGRRSLS